MATRFPVFPTASSLRLLTRYAVVLLFELSCRHSFPPPPRGSEAAGVDMAATGSHHASAVGQPSLDPSGHEGAESNGEGESHPYRR